MVFELSWEFDFFFAMFLVVFVGHFDSIVSVLDLHQASQYFYWGYSRPWMALNFGR